MPLDAPTTRPATPAGCTLEAGDIFWATSQGIADEEQGRHPWIVLSSPHLARHGGLLIAVPITSNPTRYKSWDVYVSPVEITRADDVDRPLDPHKLEGVVKCAKLRRWSITRVDEVVGSATQFFVNKLRGVAADALGMPRAHL